MLPSTSVPFQLDPGEELAILSSSKPQSKVLHQMLVELYMLCQLWNTPLKASSTLKPVLADFLYWTVDVK